MEPSLTRLVYNALNNASRPLKDIKSFGSEDITTTVQTKIDRGCVCIVPKATRQSYEIIWVGTWCTCVPTNDFRMRIQGSSCAFGLCWLDLGGFAHFARLFHIVSAYDTIHLALINLGGSLHPNPASAVALGHSCAESDMQAASG